MTTPVQPNGHHPAPRAAQPQPGNELVSPVPMNVTVWPIDSAGGPGVVGMRVATPVGGLHFYFAADEAIQIGNQLRHHGKAAKTGLALPPGVNLGGDDDGDGDATGPTILT